MKSGPATDRNEISFVYFVFFVVTANCAVLDEPTTKHTKVTVEGDPQISQIPTDDFNPNVAAISENPRNLYY